MLQESYKNQGNVGESAVAFKKTSSNKWNPNVPFTCTQEEFWEHIHQIEQGEFMTIEEADKEFELWEKELLVSRMSLA
jgi:hypothetical protein